MVRELGAEWEQRLDEHVQCVPSEPMRWHR